MFKSTPADLAVAFRSLSRRLREAIDAGETPATALIAQVDAIVGQAAVLVGSAPDAAAIADAIDARPAGEWDTGTLEALRDHAVEAGVLVRQIAERD